MNEPVLPGIDEAPVRDWLADRVGEVDELSFHQVEGGHSCLTYVMDTDRGRFVLRRPPVGNVLATAHDVLREHRIITALAGSDVPVAPVVGACDDTDVIGAPFYVMDFVDGVVLHDRAAAETLSEGARRHAGESMVEVLAALQAIEPDDVGLGDFAKRTDYLGRQLRRWHAQWESADTRPFPRMDELHQWLVANKPEEGPARIVHGDFRLGNAIHRPDGSVAALLDWELSTLGPPTADFSYLLRAWADPEAAGTADAPSAAAGSLTRDELVGCYEAAIGRAVDDLSYWMAFHAWRSAAITAGVFTRYKHGQMGGRPDNVSQFEDAIGVSLGAGLAAAGIS